MSKSNTSLNSAKRAKDDEFYTLLEDVERELSHYKSELEGKRVYLNCDQADMSNFYKYLSTYFKELGLKSLTATYYNRDGQGEKWVKESAEDESVHSLLEGDGDFRSKECIILLEEADIIITNPPFSLFKEWMNMVINTEKDFLVVGNMNAVSYQGILDEIIDNRIWSGYTKPKKFIRPDGTEQALGNVIWYTNLKGDQSRKGIEFKEQDINQYKHYTSHPDIIEVGRVKEMPVNYDGKMGLPVTYFENHDPEKYKISAVIMPESGERTYYKRFVVQKIKE